VPLTRDMGVIRTITIVTYPTYGKNLRETIRWVGILWDRHAPSHFAHNMTAFQPRYSTIELNVVHCIIITLRQKQLM
jgi:hypothetical protein